MILRAIVIWRFVGTDLAGYILEITCACVQF